MQDEVCSVVPCTVAWFADRREVIEVVVQIAGEQSHEDVPQKPDRPHTRADASMRARFRRPALSFLYARTDPGRGEPERQLDRGRKVKDRVRMCKESQSRGRKVIAKKRLS